MANAEGNRGARASQPPWVASVVGGGHEEAGLLAPPRVVPGGSSGSAAAADRVSGATICRAHAPQRADAVDGAQEARLLWLPDDVQQEVEVVTEEATVPQQDEEMGGEVEAGADQGAWCAWAEEVLLVADTVQVVEVVSEEEAGSRQHADEGPGLQVQLMEGVERHGMELFLPLEGTSQLVGAVFIGVDVGGWAEWALSEYGGPEEEGEEYRDGQGEVLEVHDNIQEIQLLSVPGPAEGLSEGGDVEQWGEEEKQMAQEKDEDEDEEGEDQEEDEDEEAWERQQELPEVHDSMCLVQLAAESGQQEGWEEWALPEDGDVEEDEVEDEDYGRQQQLLEVHESMQVMEVVTDRGQQEGWEQWALSEGGNVEEEEAQEEACEWQREVLEGQDITQIIQVMSEPGHQEGWEERAGTGESAVEGEEESEGLPAIRTGWLEEKPRALAQVGDKALAVRRAETVRAADSVGPPLEQLEALQRHLGPVTELVSRAQSRLKLKILRSWKRLLKLRSSIVQCIPGFWAQVFVNHPEMSAMMGEQDADVLSYMTDLQVEDVRHRPDCCQIMLFFASNPYFHDKLVVKEYVTRDSGYLASGATSVRRYQHCELEARSPWQRDGSLNLFDWLCEPTWAGSDRIAEIICEDLWPDPLRYHVRNEPRPSGNGSGAAVTVLSPGHGNEKTRESCADGNISWTSLSCTESQ